MSERRILWLGEPGADDVALVGGKAASLSRLADVHRVPPGFCVTAPALQEIPAPDGWPVYEEERRRWVAPEMLGHALAEAYGTLAERAGEGCPSVAVRSSAADEDGAFASFAGQHETYLNIVGPEAVERAVGACLASAYSPRALEYRRRNGLDRSGVKLAVLVQHLVRADWSAVVFSANPVTGNRDEVMINASWGLGESIVGGTVTPDAYVVRKADRSITSRIIADKRRMTVPAPDGTREVDVPRFLREQPVITEAQAEEMAELAERLEAAMGHAVDIECAYADGQLYLLQCRPITTLEHGAGTGAS